MENSATHILVIRLSAMGDCALAVPVLLRLIKTYPEIKITIITKEFFVPIFKVLPSSQVKVIGVDTKKEYKGFFGILKLGRELKKLNFNQIADLHNVLRSKILRTQFSFSNIKSAKIDKGRTEKKALTRAENKIFKALKTTPQRYVDVFQNLGYSIDLEEDVKLEKPKLTQNIKEIIENSSQKLVGIAPFAAHQSKTYPLDLMKKIIEDLNRKNYKILLFGGGKKEVNQLEKISSTYKNVISIAGKLAFKEELKLIAHLDLMLAMDSGNGHLAAMYDIPVITIWGATHPYAGFAPFQQKEKNQFLPDLKKYPLLPTSVFGNKEVEGYEEVMRSIDPEKVKNRIVEILNS